MCSVNTKQYTKLCFKFKLCDAVNYKPDTSRNAADILYLLHFSMASRDKKILSFNMHGFNQGSTTIKELIESMCPDVFMLQEHWLTPANLSKFDIFSNYFTFGCSAMNNVVESGMLVGRPFGGVIFMINNRLRHLTRTIQCCERFAVVKLGNIVVANIYLPCSGTPDRLLICHEIFSEIGMLYDDYADHNLLLAGDLNTNLDSNDCISCLINSFCAKYSLYRCDKLFSRSQTVTYINESLNQSSTIDFMLTSSPDDVFHFEILEPATNFSDHLPLLGTFACTDQRDTASKKLLTQNADSIQLRWDHADLVAFYEFTRLNAQPIYDSINDAFCKIDCRTSQPNDVERLIDQCYDDIVRVLNEGAKLYVPQQRKNFYKFWWDQELRSLKAASVESDRLWKAVGKPRQGPIFVKRQSCRSLYRKKIREGQQADVVSYSNDLHDALLQKMAMISGSVGIRNLSQLINAAK